MNSERQRLSTQVKFLLLLFECLIGVLCQPLVSEAQGIIPIGQIQGPDDESPLQGQIVSLRGIVTGIMEDENASGIRYYTFFVQDIEGSEDGDPNTSDGISIFTGRRQPFVALGDIVQVTGRVTEFYGLTEIDDAGLLVAIESHQNPIPSAVEIDPPNLNQEAAIFFEKFEGMMVKVPAANVIGPTHIGCGFAVVRADKNLERIFRQKVDDPVGQVLNVLHKSDVDCVAMPILAVGDLVDGLSGPLTYHFDRFKIVLQDPSALQVTRRELPEFSLPYFQPENQISIATFNLENYFDEIDDTGDIAEPKPLADEVAFKREKIAIVISDVLGCPTILGLQEVEKRSLLEDLVEGLFAPCGFSYEISHLETPDARGLDLAMLSNPEHVEVLEVYQHQTCTHTDTEVIDHAVECPEGEEPLFSRPPLQVNATVNDQRFTILVNHFKSKRDGESATEPQRLAQAAFIHGLIIQLIKEDGLAVIVLGDFNDYEKSQVMERIKQGDILKDGLVTVPANLRYSSIFDGSSQLTDWILVSQTVADWIVSATIAHVNADFPYQPDFRNNDQSLLFRSSDHDIPVVIMDIPRDTNGSINGPEELIDLLEPPEPASQVVVDIDLTSTRSSNEELVTEATEIVSSFDQNEEQYLIQDQITPTEPAEFQIRVERQNWVWWLLVFVAATILLSLSYWGIRGKYSRRPKRGE